MGYHGIIPSYQDLQVEVQRAVLEELSQAGLSLGGHLEDLDFIWRLLSTSNLFNFAAAVSDSSE